MWCGTAADFYAMYRAVATTLKAYDGRLVVGGPAVALPGTGFIDYVVANAVPLDFFSWHSYGSAATRVESIASTVLAVRAYLDGAGLANATQHVSEWNTDASPVARAHAARLGAGRRLCRRRAESLCVGRRQRGALLPRLQPARGGPVIKNQNR